MKRILLILAFISLVAANTATAMKGMDHGSSQNEQNRAFVHKAMIDDVHAEFQVMDLKSMDMKDPDGKTHHIMATFMRDNEKITDAVGKVKLVSPSGKEQLADLKDYGSGVFASNFTIDEPGKWGVVCLFKESGGQHTAKFWYTHMPM